MFATWRRTVCSLRCRAAAISALLRPPAIRRSTSVWRAVRGPRQGRFGLLGSAAQETVELAGEGRPRGLVSQQDVVPPVEADEARPFDTGRESPALLERRDGVVPGVHDQCGLLDPREAIDDIDPLAERAAIQCDHRGLSPSCLRWVSLVPTRTKAGPELRDSKAMPVPSAEVQKRTVGCICSLCARLLPRSRHGSEGDGADKQAAEACIVGCITPA